MRLMGYLAFVLLSMSILSYGVSGTVFAQTNNLPPVSISTDTTIYANGGNVVVTGQIKNYDPLSETAGAVTYVVTSPDNNLVTIGQLVPKSDGTFSFSFVAGGAMFKVNGDYIIEAQYGANSGETTINYVGGTQVISKPPVVEPEPPVVEPEPPVVEPEPPVVEPEPPVVEPEPPTCGAGTELVNGICKVIQEPQCPKGYSMKDGLCVEEKGGCLIATAAYGTELAPQVQFLREVRDNTVLSTVSGTAFMSGFNTIYYSFAPTVADWERENPMFQEAVKAFITPMISTLSIMSLADDGSESEVLGLGISVIVLNLGMYIAAPALIGFKVHNHIKSKK